MSASYRSHHKHTQGPSCRAYRAVQQESTASYYQTEPPYLTSLAVPGPAAGMAPSAEQGQPPAYHILEPHASDGDYDDNVTEYRNGEV